MGASGTGAMPPAFGDLGDFLLEQLAPAREETSASELDRIPSLRER
jgi:hypothetical protein